MEFLTDFGGYPHMNGYGYSRYHNVTGGTLFSCCDFQIIFYVKDVANFNHISYNEDVISYTSRIALATHIFMKVRWL